MLVFQSLRLENGSTGNPFVIGFIRSIPLDGGGGASLIRGWLAEQVGLVYALLSALITPINEP